MVSAGAGLGLYLLLLLGVGAERIAELVISNRNARAAFARGGHEAGQRHFLVMTIVHALFLPACFAEAWLLGRQPPAWLAATALLLALSAQGLRWWAIRTLGPRWNVRIVVVPGDPPVQSGPYRYLRHPNYLAVVVELFSLPLVHGAFLTSALFTVLNAGLLRVRIAAEEQALGPLYAASFTGVARLTPGARRG